MLKLPTGFLLFGGPLAIGWSWARTIQIWTHLMRLKLASLSLWRPNKQSICSDVDCVRFERVLRFMPHVSLHSFLPWGKVVRDETAVKCVLSKAAETGIFLCTLCALSLEYSSRHWMRKHKNLRGFMSTCTIHFNYAEIIMFRSWKGSQSTEHIFGNQRLFSLLSSNCSMTMTKMCETLTKLCCWTNAD